MSDNRSAKFLDLIRRSNRGRLKIYLGYGPGVGKTYQMLQEAHRLKADGLDVIVGLVETHGRKDTAALVEGLEMLPLRRQEYHGITVEEFDVDACLARKPQLAIVDELAHTNVPGSRNTKRYQDVQELLAAGIHVITAMNVQHLESLYNTVENLVGVKVRERVPDSVLVEADQVVNIDVAPEDLQKRLQDGKIYPKARIASSLENFFRAQNLEHLRELALRELASQIDARRREWPERVAPASEQIMVCLSSRGPNGAKLLRFGSRLAGRFNRNWYAVYVQTPSEEATKIDAVTQRLLSDTLTLANQLGATVFTFKGTDIADTLLRFAREYRVGQIVIGKPHPIPVWRRLTGKRSVAEELIFKADQLTVIVVDADARELTDDASRLNGDDTGAALASDLAKQGISAGEKPPVIAALSDPRRILIFDDPVSREQVLNGLLEAIARDNPAVDVKSATERLAAREKQGSTFLNEGVALPHARIDGLPAPEAALAITHAGILDAPTANPVEVVVLLLSPSDVASAHLQMLAVAGRLLQNRDLRKAIKKAKTSEEVAAAVQQFTASGGLKAPPKPVKESVK
jgi:two-component system, OmpR family, sensor histidine kinase KdpD